MPPGVKICGLTRVADVEWAVACGADAIGLVLAPSPRQVAKRNVRELLRAAGPDVIKVAVFRFFSDDDVLGLTDLGFDAVQGGGKEEGVPAMPATLAFLPVINDGPRLQARAANAMRAGHRPAIAGLDRLGNPTVLLDGPRGGGGGVAADTGRAMALARCHRIVLAGGLTPENVARSVAAVGPVAVDVSTGVESGPGLKNHQRVKAFIEAARAPAITREAIS